MAAYAALVSVMHIIEQIEHHPFPPISLDKKQVEALTKNIMNLQEFLEGYAPTEDKGDGLESRILDAANAAEDVIESHVVDSILAGSKSHCDHVGFQEGLQKVIENIDLVKNEVIEIKKKMGVQHQTQRKSTSSFSGKKHNTTMVGFDSALLEILDKLTGGRLDRKIIPIVGMGGMGKTTLARNVYAHPLINEHFDILAWATISQEYDALSILLEILSQANKDKGTSSEMNEIQIGGDLYKYLFGRRYLIVMDDMWNIEAWDKIQFFFPDNNNDSRIVVTTRISDLARRLGNSYGLQMKFLESDESWNLFSKTVSPRGGYPLDMVEIGKKIVTKCRGLPLSIVVVGGFLAKSEYKREHWEYIEENLSSFVNSDNDELCLKILLLSYNQLPVHLKPCFLYMGLLKEDSEIRISMLVKLWVAEGFLKPISSKVLEEAAAEYLDDLVERNLILVVKNRRKCVKIHDLLRDLCWKQAEAERFYSVVTQRSVTIPHDQRRFVVCEDTLEEEARDALLGLSSARSVMCYANARTVYPWIHHRLLRISGTYFDALIAPSYFCFEKNELQPVNLRYLVALSFFLESKFATSLHLLWSLQTFIIHSDSLEAFNMPAEIWNMPQLRHVVVHRHMYLPDPPVCNEQDRIVLENLQTLKLVRSFKCSEEVVKRIPNIKKLGLVYEGDDKFEESCLENLDRLHKLRSFYCFSSPGCGPDEILHRISFPHSLTKLALYATLVDWEDMLEKIGSLPLLRKLELKSGYFRTRKWETIEGQFPSLKFLKIDQCYGLKYWNSECSHFPRLEHLVLQGLHSLKEISSGIGEIPTLESIELICCSKSAAISCKQILEEQEELHGEEEVTLRVRVEVDGQLYKRLKNLASRNFVVDKWM